MMHEVEVREGNNVERMEVKSRLGIPGYETRAVFGSVGVPKCRKLGPAEGFWFELDLIVREVQNGTVVIKDGRGTSGHRDRSTGMILRMLQGKIGRSGLVDTGIIDRRVLVDSRNGSSCRRRRGNGGDDGFFVKIGRRYARNRTRNMWETVDDGGQKFANAGEDFICLSGGQGSGNETAPIWTCWSSLRGFTYPRGKLEILSTPSTSR